MSLTRSQLAFLITFFTLSIVVLTMFNIHLGASMEEEYVIEMSLADEELEAMLEEIEEQERQAKNDPVKSHMALNETAKPSFGTPEPLKTLEEIMAEREAMEPAEPAEDMSSDEYASTLRQLAQMREERKESLGEKEAEKKEYTNYLKDRRTSISYSLVDRNAYELPPPIYTCIEGGKVVINIEVDDQGFVTDASFNASSSGTSNGCLVENAIAYALKARFSASQKAQQKGTITYLFQSK
jgi:TonB family protein